MGAASWLWTLDYVLRVLVSTDRFESGVQGLVGVGEHAPSWQALQPVGFSPCFPGVLLRVFALHAMGKRDSFSFLGEVMGCCESQPELRVHFRMLLA